MRTMGRAWWLYLRCLATALFVVPAARAAEGEGKHLHALLVLDTDAARAKELGIVADGRRILGLLEGAYQVREKGKRAGRVTTTVLTGEDVTPENIKAYFNGLPKDLSSDTILFFYSGHGGSVMPEQVTPLNQGHYLAMRRGVVWRKDLKEWVRAHKPRLAVVLTDCCSNFNDQDETLALKAAKGEGPAFRVRKGGPEARPEPRAKSGAPVATEAGADRWAAATARSLEMLGRMDGANEPKVDWQTVRGLFFFNSGIADVTAALPGDFATGVRNKGGRFTRTLIDALETGHKTDWRGLTTDVGHRTQLQTGAYEQGGLTVIPRAGPLGAPNGGLGIEMCDNIGTDVQAIPFGLGIELRPTSELAQKDAFTDRPLKYPGRMFVASVVPKWPADKAGLRDHDCILKVDGKAIQTPTDFFSAVGHKPRRVRVEYAREVDFDTHRWETRTTDLDIPKDDEP
jgi:PDZ domain/Caspase domain